MILINSLSFSLSSEHSLSKNIDDFEHLIQTTNTDFNIIAVSESRITKNKLPLTDIKFI